MSFQEAINLATNGFVSQGVVDSIRFELTKSQDASPAKILSLKTNLAVALMQLANNSPLHDLFIPLYRESEDLLLSILKVEPTNEIAQGNLAVLRKNKDLVLDRNRNERGRPHIKDTLPSSESSKAKNGAQASQPYHQHRGYVFRSRRNESIQWDVSN